MPWAVECLQQATFLKSSVLCSPPHWYDSCCSYLLCNSSCVSSWLRAMLLGLVIIILVRCWGLTTKTMQSENNPLNCCKKYFKLEHTLFHLWERKEIWIISSEQNQGLHHSPRNLAPILIGQPLKDITLMEEQWKERIRITEWDSFKPHSNILPPFSLV